MTDLPTIPRLPTQDDPSRRREHPPLPRVLGLNLTHWAGHYQGVEATWLHWARADGGLLPTPQELAGEAESRASQAESRAESLAARLREMGIDPDTLS